MYGLFHAKHRFVLVHSYVFARLVPPYANFQTCRPFIMKFAVDVMARPAIYEAMRTRLHLSNPFRRLWEARARRLNWWERMAYTLVPVAGLGGSTIPFVSP